MITGEEARGDGTAEGEKTFAKKKGGDEKADLKGSRPGWSSTG